MFPATFRLFVLILPLSLLHGQTPTFRLYSGSYVVTADYQGQPMTPWASTNLVRDTMVGGRKMIAVVHHATHKDTGGEFESTAIFDHATARLTALDGYNHGRRVDEYHLVIANGKIVGPDNGDDGNVTINETISPDAVPDFAMGAWLASRALKDRDSVKVHVFTYTSTGVHPFDFAGDVKSVDSTWVVTGRAGYPMKAVIAKADGVVLELTTPQGSDGSMTETWKRKAP